MFLKNINQSVKQGAKFVFDSWHSPSVYAIGPSSRIVEVADDAVLSNAMQPSVNLEDNVIDVNFEFEVCDLASKQNPPRIFSEVHSMRPIPELKMALNLSGFEVLCL